METVHDRAKFTLITNRKSAIVFQNLPSNLTCDATWRRNRHYVTSGFTNKITDIVYNSETVGDRAKVNINPRTAGGGGKSATPRFF